MLITAKIQKPIERISQCDIFKDVDVVEYVKETEGKVIVSTFVFSSILTPRNPRCLHTPAL